jgi:hypothetical protein
MSEQEVAGYLNQIEGVVRKTLEDPEKYESFIKAGYDREAAKRGVAWLAKMDVLEFLERAESVFVPVGSQLRTIRLEIAGETEKAWKVVCHSSIFDRPLVEWVPKSQARRAGTGLFVKSWLIRAPSCLRDAAIEFVSTHLANKSDEYKEVADLLFRQEVMDQYESYLRSRGKRLNI